MFKFFDDVKLYGTTISNDLRLLDSNVIEIFNRKKNIFDIHFFSTLLETLEDSTNELVKFKERNFKINRNRYLLYPD